MDRDIEYELESEFTLANAVQPAPRKGDFSKRFYEEKERRKLASQPTTNDVREHSQLPCDAHLIHRSRQAPRWTQNALFCTA